MYSVKELPGKICNIHKKHMIVYFRGLHVYGHNIGQADEQKQLSRGVPRKRCSENMQPNTHAEV